MIDGNERLRTRVDKWQDWADYLQFGSLGMLFGSIFILESMTKAEARTVVWYLAGAIMIVATIAVLVARKATQLRALYFRAEADRIEHLFRRIKHD